MELVFALHRNLRGRLAGWHGRGDSLLRQVVDQVEELLLLSTLWATLGLDLLLVVVSLLRLQVNPKTPKPRRYEKRCQKI